MLIFGGPNWNDDTKTERIYNSIKSLFEFIIFFIKGLPFMFIFLLIIYIILFLPIYIDIVVFGSVTTWDFIICMLDAQCVF